MSVCVSLDRSSCQTTATPPLRFIATAGASWSPVATLFAADQVTDDVASSSETSACIVISSDGQQAGLAVGDDERLERADRGVVLADQRHRAEVGAHLGGRNRGQRVAAAGRVELQVRVGGRVR